MDVKLAQIVVGVEVFRFELNRLPEFHSCQFRLSQAHQVGRQVGSGGCGIRLQAHCLLQVRAGFRVLRLRGIDQAQEFVDIEAFGDFAHQASSRWAASGEMARFVLRHGGLEFTVQVRSLSLGGHRRRDPRQPEQGNERNEPTGDRCRMITVFPC